MVKGCASTGQVVGSSNEITTPEEIFKFSISRIPGGGSQFKASPGSATNKLANVGKAVIPPTGGESITNSNKANTRRHVRDGTRYVTTSYSTKWA